MSDKRAAEEADGDSELPIRPLANHEEFAACVRLQEETWGEGFSERVPSAILQIAARMGGVVSGAFLDDGRLAGFVFGLTGLDRDGALAHWSDMLAVRPELRGRGLGHALKLHQRELLLERGVERVYWTFDPLVARNAHLNFMKLGVVAREYVEDMYGASDSPLHRGIGTDRLVVLWELKSPRVLERLAATRASSEGGAGSLPSDLEAEAVLEGRGDGSRPEPTEPVLALDLPVLSVAVPDEIQALKEADPQLASRWRRATRTALRHYLERGWEVRELDRSGNLPRYRLVRSIEGRTAGPTDHEGGDRD